MRRPPSGDAAGRLPRSQLECTGRSWTTAAGLPSEHPGAHPPAAHAAPQVLYRAAKARFDEEEDFKTRAREAVTQLQGGNPEYHQVRQYQHVGQYHQVARRRSCWQGPKLCRALVSPCPRRQHAWMAALQRCARAAHPLPCPLPHRPCLQAWQRICDASRREFQKIYDRLGVTLSGAWATGLGRCRQQCSPPSRVLTCRMFPWQGAGVACVC